MKGMVWLQNELRLNDNTALYYATKTAKKGLIAVYFITPTTWKSHDMASCKVQFILNTLSCLSKSLLEKNISLIVEKLETIDQIPEKLIQLSKKHEINQLFFTKQYEVNEKKLGEKVKATWEKEVGEVFEYDDQLIFPPGTIKTKQNDFYTVFTPFKKKWLAIFSENPPVLLPNIEVMTNKIAEPSRIPSSLEGFLNETSLASWPAAEKEAIKRLEGFIKNKITHYDEDRDFPAKSGTSELSPYLAIGAISAKYCFLSVTKGREFEALSKGEQTFLSELVWREFYKNILFAFPRVSMHIPFNLSTQSIPWSQDKKLFLAWKEGKTGYPLVDAAMRQLNQTGWMHNRLRMVTAMFLTKILLIDWRWGEQYFMQRLIDGDLAANNGGWQWSASTGTDAVPYFRIFNPTRQSERFDPAGHFIRQYCPELADFDNKTIHEPYRLSPLLASACGYPPPIVDYATNKAITLAAFKKKKKENKVNDD